MTIISESNNHMIIAISETEAGKIQPKKKYVWVNSDTGEEAKFLNFYIDFDAEIKKLMYANSINDLMVKFIRKDKFENDKDMLVMERLYPIDFKTLSKNDRISFYDKFDKQITELHVMGFIHGDIMHPVRAEPDFLFNNIITTENGLRLVDTGFSIIEQDEPDKERYRSLLRQELYEVIDFKNCYLF